MNGTCGAVRFGAVRVLRQSRECIGARARRYSENKREAREMGLWSIVSPLNTLSNVWEVTRKAVAEMMREIKGRWLVGR